MRKDREVGTVVETEIFPGIVVGIGVGALRVIVVYRQRTTQSVLRPPIGVVIFPIFLRRSMLNSSQSCKRLKRTFTESSINALAHLHRQRARSAWPVSNRPPRMTNSRKARFGLFGRQLPSGMTTRMVIVLTQALTSREIGVFSPKDPRQKLYGIPGGRRIPHYDRHPNPPQESYSHSRRYLSPRHAAFHHHSRSCTLECSLRRCPRNADGVLALVGRSPLLVCTSV